MSLIYIKKKHLGFSVLAENVNFTSIIYIYLPPPSPLQPARARQFLSDQQRGLSGSDLRGLKVLHRPRGNMLIHKLRCGFLRGSSHCDVRLGPFNFAACHSISPFLPAATFWKNCSLSLSPAPVCLGNPGLVTVWEDCSAESPEHRGISGHKTGCDWVSFLLPLLSRGKLQSPQSVSIHVVRNRKPQQWVLFFFFF